MKKEENSVKNMWTLCEIRVVFCPLHNKSSDDPYLIPADNPINPIKNAPLPTVFVFYLENLQTTRIWNLLTFLNFGLRMPL